MAHFRCDVCFENYSPLGLDPTKKPPIAEEEGILLQTANGNRRAILNHYKSAAHQMTELLLKKRAVAEIPNLPWLPITPITEPTYGPTMVSRNSKAINTMGQDKISGK